MPGRPPGPILKTTVPLVVLAWVAVLVGFVWGLDWRWIPTALLTGAALILVAGFVEVQLDQRAEDREADEARRAYLAAQEEHWLTGQEEQQR